MSLVLLDVLCRQATQSSVPELRSLRPCNCLPRAGAAHNILRRRIGPGLGEGKPSGESREASFLLARGHVGFQSSPMHHALSSLVTRATWLQIASPEEGRALLDEALDCRGNYYFGCTGNSCVGCSSLHCSFRMLPRWALVLACIACVGSLVPWAFKGSLLTVSHGGEPHADAVAQLSRGSQQPLKMGCAQLSPSCRQGASHCRDLRSLFFADGNFHPVPCDLVCNRLHDHLREGHCLPVASRAAKTRSTQVPMQP